ncbi:DUF6470 family protein [Paenibacillus sp. JTLBN-2024]|uniref:Uncharacterized protein n=1 Tax=Paenibacillus cookii TaxID=157839 RepID=A0ABQ4LWC8_9BACL|nr:DUF6470 family protein [Paenibacillus cookii]GIO67580.1 hypothetical protein J21TS3_24010 [Paenibacillus cookii]
MNLLRLSIRQNFASIGIETNRARLDIESPPGDLEIQSSPSVMKANTDKEKLTIDSSRAWMALGKGYHMEWLRLISSQMNQELLLNVSRIVEEGNQLAKFAKQGSSIADMVVKRTQEKSSIQCTGDASCANVDVQYTPAKVELEWSPQKIDMTYTPQQPRTSYVDGKVDIYIKNKNSLTMWVSNYDTYA